jgi:hypothetical protein
LFPRNTTVPCTNSIIGVINSSTHVSMLYNL